MKEKYMLHVEFDVAIDHQPMEVDAVADEKSNAIFQKMLAEQRWRNKMMEFFDNHGLLNSIASLVITANSVTR
jgi:hypothetical protein